MTGASEPVRETAFDDRAAIAGAASSFEGQVLVAVLRDAGLDAVAVEGGRLRRGGAIEPVLSAVTIYVPRRDLARGRAVLAARAADSTDIDWERVDLGVRDDKLPLRPPGRMPLAARVAFAVAIAMVMIGLVAGVVVVVAR